MGRGTVATEPHSGAADGQLNLCEMSKTQPLESILEHRIRMRAYELYEQHGRREGFALRDWLQAEEEILPRLSPPENLAQ
jgi:DUF2934 family protein